MVEEITDINIIEEILAGDKEKYALLMRKYNPRLYRVSKAYLQDEMEIEDVMQESYIKAYQNLKKFEGRSLFSTWLTRILVNECLQRLNKTRKVTRLGDNEEEIKSMNLTDKKNPETESLNKELKNVLETNIALLPGKYREVFIMREVEKMSVEETSEALDITSTNVKVRLNRAKEMLRTALMGTYPLGQVFEFNLVRCERIARNVLARI